MELTEAIRNRRSIRQFVATPVPHELLVQILEAGIWAPSSKNLQPWHFVVLQGVVKNRVADILQSAAVRMTTDPDPRERIRAISARRSAEIIREAPVLITVWNTAPVTAGEQAVQHDPNSGRLLGWSVEIQSVAAAIENMLLTAHSLGLGGLWNCDLNHAALEVREHLSVEHDLVAGIVIGYARETPTPPPRRAIAQVVTWLEGV